jgi:hypothetical protein
MTRTLGIALAMVFLIPASAAGGAPIPKDALCPGATPYVQRYNEQAADPNTPVDDFAATINKAIDAYDRCTQTMVTSGSAEGRHYSQMRSAQFHVALGRLQRLLDNYESARASLQAALALVKDTIEWRASGTGQRAESIYKEPALTIRLAAQAELEKLPKPAAPASTASPS